MNIIKKPYEISIWKDVLMYVGTPIEGKTSPTSNLADLSSVDYQYYDEARLATIGSDVMTSPARAVNPVFKKNINGTETLTFDMYYQYEDIESGELVRNPLINLVVDERKVKLYYEDQWYDFIVKKDDEKGRDYKYSYTCTGLAANELGKTGFNIELDTELENNMGTVQELGAAVLQGSDWQLAQEGQEIIQQTNEEALYSLVLTSAITTAKNLDGTSFSSNIPIGARIYAYYTPYMNQEKDYFQFIYVDGDTGTLLPDLLEDKITIYCNGTRTFDLYVSNVEWENDRPNFATGNPTVAQYRGLRYVRKQLTAYDPVLEQTVLKYTRDNTEYYGYTTTSYIDTTTVQNYVYNSVNFAGTSYWGIYGNSDNKSIKAEVFPSVKVSNTDLERAGYLVAQFGNTAARLVNEGVVQNYSRINIFTKGEKYRLRIKVGTVSENTYTPLTGEDLPFNCIVKKYKLIDVDTPAEDIIYFDSTDSSTIMSVDGDDYTILDVECLNSATWRELKDTVGIFFGLKSDSDEKYYIKDVQFYKYLIGKNGVVIAPDDPVENLPDVRIETKYHFYDPAQNIGKLIPEDYIFSEEDPSLYTPLYGTGESEFEKVRSITAKESNRFNLLQELSETFECWVRFSIEHESNGRIKIEEFDYYDLVNLAEGVSTSGYYIYDWYNKQYIEPTESEAIKGQKYYSKVTRQRQVKKVTFYKEILIDNYAGFKYGINLKDNNRTLDSEQIVTKIIVKDNTCEQAENGFCSIARAQDNPIKENFAYNFDYFTSQGIIDWSTLNNDLYLEINGSIGLYPRLSRLNKERNDLIDSAAPLANSINDLSSKYQVAALEYNAAEKELQRIKDPQSGTIYQYTHYRYDDFYNQIGRVEDNTDVPSYANEIYYIKSGNVSLTITPDSGDLLYVIHTNDTTPQSGKTYYYISSSKFVLFTSTKFRDTIEYYEAVSAQGTTGTYFQTAATTTKLTFSGVESTDEVYIYGAARRRVPDLGDEDYIDDNFTISTLEKITTQEANKAQAQEEMEHYGADLETTQAQYDAIQDQLKTIANATDEVEKEFNVKYARYIQEGSWTDDNYMDDDLYYLDSLAVLYQSAFPKVSYNFSVIDLSQIEDYELYKFDIGHKTFVEDIEFFGYQIVNNLKTPVKEQVVVTEESLYLDEPDKNQLKVQNYKSHFEDLFQRITAATQTLEYHSGEYGRAAGAITPEGEVSANVMQKTFANSSYVITNSRDQSVTWDDTGLQAVNLGDPLQITRLASAGLLVSADGGQTWGVAISGYGINTNYLTAGVIDADNINIMSGAYPTFRWDSSGLNAYGFTTDDQGNVLSYDPTRFVNYSRFGLYGVNGLLNPDIDSLEDIENSAAFALTWNGLFMRAQHRDGFVRVSPTEDFAVYQTITENNASTDILRGKFGLLGEDEDTGDEIFGLALYKPELDDYDQPIPTVLTQSNGTLWLLDSMRIGTPTQTNTIYIGVGEVDTTPGANRYKVINVNDTSDQERFVVYSDGSLKASNANITGIINATGGSIGNMDIATLTDTIGVRVTPSTGTFKVADNVPTPSSIEFSYKSSIEDITAVKWKHSTTTNISYANPDGTGETYTYTYDPADFNNGIMYLGLQITSGSGAESETYTDRITISKVSDGARGRDGLNSNSFIIHTPTEEILKFNSNNEVSDQINYNFSLNEIQITAQDLTDLTSIPIIQYLPITVGSTEFNENKTAYYYKVNDNYIQCTESSVYDPNIQYYLKKSYFTISFNFANYSLDEVLKSQYYSDYVYDKLSSDDYYSYYFNIQDFYEDLYDGDLDGKINDTGFDVAEVISFYKIFFESFSSEDIIISSQIHLVDNSSVNTEKILQIKNGLSEQMVKFSVNAADITAAIETAGLVFNLQGLTVTNAGFRIQTGSNGNYTDVFYVDENTGRLYMDGDGVFHGTIYAENGEFTGYINSSSGFIGGFEIGDHYIKSPDLELYSSYIENGVVKESSINVKNINIGNGAQVSGSITIGNLKLLNPSENDGNVLTLINNGNNYFTLTDSGNIIGNNWSIKNTTNGVVADFGKVIARDGEFSGTIHATDGDFSNGTITAGVINAPTINAASFTTEKTRAMGGTYIFKPTFQIASIEETETSNVLEITLTSDSSVSIENYIPDLSVINTDVIVSISGDDTRYGKIVDKDGATIDVYLYNTDYSTILAQIEKYNTVTLFGYGNTDLLIGINSDDNTSILPPRSLVMEEFTNLINSSGTGNIDYQIRLLLGDLANVREVPGTGYGLYADNVFLRGSLTTAGTSGTTSSYAGINTQRSIPFRYNLWNSGDSTPSEIYKDDKIIFWGGASGAEDSWIQTSPFIVTDKGNVFARSGEFKGSVISDSLITHTTIEAPVIWGNNNAPNEPSLKIYNTDNTEGGIGFYKVGSQNEDILTLVLSDNGFYYDSQSAPFVEFNNGQINVNVINVGTGTTNLRQGFLEDGQSSIQFNNGVEGVKLASSQANIQVLTNEIINDATTVTNKNSMIIRNGADNSTEMLKYTINNGYYCLYVEE